VGDRDYTPEAEALFGRLAKRYGLEFVVEGGVPMEVCWTFPVQPHLSRPITLGLQNLDELNFGVGGLWAYFFPFPDHADRFERIVGSWIEGKGRVAVTGGRSCNLQLLEGAEWKTVYSQNGCVWFFWMTPKRYLRNETPPASPADGL
jgi:hypothetical protein